MSGLKGYLIDGLGEDDGYWRVDWYGNLTYENGHKRFSQPCIDVYLSKLKKEPNEIALNYKNSTEFKKQKKIKLPIEYLVVLRLGDIWRKGKLVKSPKYKKIEKSVLINSSTCHTIMAGSKNEDDDYYINFSHHPYHKEATNTFCEVISLSGTNDIIVVPHYVIAQTYFSRSSYVFSQLFTHGLTFDTFYDGSKSEHVRDGISFIHLKTKVHDIAAPEVARIAWDKFANNAVGMISKTFALQSANEWPITLKTKFPFEVHILPHHEHPFWLMVNTDSGGS